MQRQGIKNRRDKRIHIRHGNRRQASLTCFGQAFFAGKQNNISAARHHLLHVGHGFFKQGIVGGDGNDGHVFVDQCDRAMLQLAGGKSFGVNIGNFLQLQRALKRQRIHGRAPDKQGAGGRADLLGKLFDLRFAIQHGIGKAWGRQQ